MERKPQRTVILAILLTVTIWLQEADGLQCYKCTMTAPSPYTNETTRLCSNFDYSDKYIVNCPYSTLCMKKDFSVNFTVPINGTVRDCAHQRYDYQDYKNGKWQLEVAIEEPYTEGCSTIDDKGVRSSRTQFCYCRGELCNSAPGMVSAKWASVLAVFAVLLFKHTYRIP